MNKVQKEMIEKAKPFTTSDLLFNAIYIINSGKEYAGFWGKNGYKNIIILGQVYGKTPKETETYLLNDGDCDILHIENETNHRLAFEIPNDTNCLHMWVLAPYKIKCYLPQSCITLQVVKLEEPEKIKSWRDKIII